MQRLQRFIDWVDPLHEIAMESTGLSDFGRDKSYLIGLRVLLEQQDQESDLKRSTNTASTRTSPWT